jgi:hypothetical protein
MPPASILRFGPLALAALALALPCGCGAPRVAEPTPAQLQAALEGQAIASEDVQIPIAAGSVGGFKVLQIHHNLKESTSAAEVEFNYVSESGSYKVQGVISYLRTPSETLKDPRFETNELTDL